jgi:hypothetical protein
MLPQTGPENAADTADNGLGTVSTCVRTDGTDSNRLNGLLVSSDVSSLHEAGR